MAFVPEGQGDRSQARSAWDADPFDRNQNTSYFGDRTLAAGAELVIFGTLRIRNHRVSSMRARRPAIFPGINEEKGQEGQTRFSSRTGIGADLAPRIIG